MKSESETAFQEQIEDGHSVRILLFLLQNGKVVRSVVYARASNSTNTAKVKVDKLLKTGLIQEIEEPMPPKRKWVELTEKGQRVAEKLAEIEKELVGE